ncbi:MAG: hypothetical protein NZ841_06660 [Dictyoglomus sp.]|nr:hypothetical protein [Dictyoglomus sp.]MDW8188960.1 hypothetical protein [Dictyoglomus sp.]
MNRNNWWDRRPSLVIYPEINIISKGVDENEISYIKNYFKEFYLTLSEYFHEYESKVYIYKENSLEFKNGFDIPFGVILNPVLLGEISKEILISSNDEDEVFYQTLREKLPEVYPPLGISVGRDLLKISPSPHPNFINVIFIRDENDFILNLPYHRKVSLFRMLMAKIGAFKNIIIPYKFSKNELQVFGFILSTMEGGCPILKDIKELGKRLRIFGSCKEVGGYIRREDIVISHERWVNSPVVNSVINLGKYLGEVQLLSPPVRINSLVRDERLGRFISAILSYSRQAEGAFMAYEPFLDLFIVTASGKYNVDKSNLNFSDLVPIFPTSNGKVEVFKIENIDLKGPSVEAEEFTLPFKEISSKIPPIIGIIHLHRGLEYFDSSLILEIPQDLEKYPPVGCGVDLMHAMSRYAIFYAVEKKQQNSEYKLAVFSVPNHGTNIYCFYEEEILENPFYYFVKFIEEGKLKFKFEVNQI